MLLDQLSALIRLNDLESRVASKGGNPDPQVQREIDRCRQALDNHLLELYEARRRKHGKTTVVPIERGSCSGCNISLPAVGLEEVAEDVHVCGQCDRLLYDPELAYDFV